jgi:hypothetical protein
MTDPDEVTGEILDPHLLPDDEDDNPADHHGWPSSALTEDTDIPEAK